MEATSACSPVTAAFNLPTALNRLGGDEGLLRDLAAFYVEDVPPLCERLSESIDRGDTEAVVRNAHTIKALSANFDAHVAVDAAQGIERAARTGELSLARDSLPDLLTAVDAVMAALRAKFFRPIDG